MNEELDARAYLQRLCGNVSRVAPVGLDLAFIGGEYLLESQTCRHLGMLVSELIEDAARFAFPDGRGVIEVELTHSDAATICRVTDDGRGFADVRRSQCIGIVYALAGRLHATLRRSSGPGGTTWSVTIPCQSSKRSVESQRRVARRAVPAMQWS